MLFNKGIPIDEDVTIENLFTTIASDTFDPELWDEEFEAYFGNNMLYLVYYVKSKLHINIQMSREIKFLIIKSQVLIF